jgi:hypothetical protein
MEEVSGMGEDRGFTRYERRMKRGVRTFGGKKLSQKYKVRKLKKRG